MRAVDGLSNHIPGSGVHTPLGEEPFPNLHLNSSRHSSSPSLAPILEVE